MFALFTEIRTHGLRHALLAGTTLRSTGRLEALLLRLLFALILWRTFDFIPTYESTPYPVGIAHWTSLWETLGWQLPRLGQPDYWTLWLPWIQLALTLYVFGIALPIALPFLAFVHIALRTLANSQGAAHHGYQMIGLVLLTQTLIVLLIAAVRLHATLRKTPPPPWAAPGNWNTLIRYSIAIAAASYITSVCTKLEKSKGDWLNNSPYVATQIVKTHRQNYYNDLDPQFIQGIPPSESDAANPANDQYRHPIPSSADWLSRHQTLARILFGAGFFLELLTFLAIIDRRFALLIGLSLILMHASISWLMELHFLFNELTVSVLFINITGWLLLMFHHPAWRPSWKLWFASLLTSAALLTAHHATLETDTPASHLLTILSEPALLLPDLLRVSDPLKWPTTLAIQTTLLAALALTLKSFAPTLPHKKTTS